MKKVFIIFGAPGIGKTTISKILYKKIDDTQYIDIDELWRIQPFIVNDINKTYVETNIKHMYASFLKHPSLKHLILTWVVPTKGLKDMMKSWFKDTEVYFYRLVAQNDVYLKRLKDDQRDESKFDDYITINQNHTFDDVMTIDVTHMRIEDVIDTLHKEITKHI
jgi:broad-specificity NMP kinase